MPKSDLYLDPKNPEKGFKTWETVESEHGVPEGWGFRTRVLYANVPHGALMHCAIGQSDPVDAQMIDGSVEHTVGGGLELHFEHADFKRDWVVFDAEDALRAEELENRVTEVAGTDPMARVAAIMSLLSNNEVRNGHPVDRRYIDETPVLDENTGEPTRAADGKYVWAHYIDDNSFLPGGLEEFSDGKPHFFRVMQLGGLELVQLQVEGPVGESDVGADPNATRTYSYWMPKSDLYVDPKNPEKGFKTWETVQSEHGMPQGRGFRTRVLYANVPHGALMHCAIGQSDPVDAQMIDGSVEHAVGGGLELHFEHADFKRDWVVFDAEDALRAEEFENRVTEVAGTDPMARVAAIMSLLSNNEVRNGHPVDRRYIDETPVLDENTGEPTRAADGK